MSVNLSTNYLGMHLRNPLVIAACPLTRNLELVKEMEAAGASAIVLPSLFEEQIEHEEISLAAAHEYGTESYAESLSYFPEPIEFASGPENYLKMVKDTKEAISIPVIASLNGVSTGGWVRYAKLCQEAGADAIELNIYAIASDPDITSADCEQEQVELVASVAQSIDIPLAVKLGPYYTSPGNLAKQMVSAGAAGLVLFNRFIQPDIDLEEMEIRSNLVLSAKPEMLLPMRWIAILRDRVPASLALTSGIHGPKSLAKALLVGADVGMTASLLYKKGIKQISSVLDGLASWMEENEYESVEQLKGSMSQQNGPDPIAYERGNYMKALVSYAGKPI